MSTSCESHWSWPLWIVLSLIVVIIQMVITIKSIKPLRSSKTNTSIKVVYFIACISGILYVISVVVLFAILSMILCMEPLLIYVTISSIFYGMYSMSISGLLLLRLHFTFRKSMFCLTNCQKYFFIISYTLLLIVGILLTLSRHIFGGFTPLAVKVFVAISALAFPLYFGMVIYGMILFIVKMYKLTKLRASSHDDDENVFNAKQQKILYAATKYVSLLSIALISTWLMQFIYIPTLLLPHQSWIIVVWTFAMYIDMIGNILCLYLQFPFTKRYYDKYCICFGNCCIYLLTKYVSRKISKDLNMNEEIPLTPREREESNSRSTSESRSVVKELNTPMTFENMNHDQTSIEHLAKQESGMMSGIEEECKNVLNQTLEEVLKIPSVRELPALYVQISDPNMGSDDEDNEELLNDTEIDNINHKTYID